MFTQSCFQEGFIGMPGGKNQLSILAAKLVGVMKGYFYRVGRSIPDQGTFGVIGDRVPVVLAKWFFQSPVGLVRPTETPTSDSDGHPSALFGSDPSGALPRKVADSKFPYGAATRSQVYALPTPPGMIRAQAPKHNLHPRPGRTGGFLPWTVNFWDG